MNKGMYFGNGCQKFVAYIKWISENPVNGMEIGIIPGQNEKNLS